MKAIITYARPDGSFDEVGMNYRRLTGEYANAANLMRYNPPKGKTRYEFYTGSIYGPPMRVYVANDTPDMHLTALIG